MGKSNLITALNNVNIYNSLLRGCKVCFNGFTAEKHIHTSRKKYVLFSIPVLSSIPVSITSIRGLHVSKSGKSICCEVEYLEDNSNNTIKLYVAFNEDKTALILHSNNNIWGTIPADYKCISDPINNTEIVE